MHIFATPWRPRFRQHFVLQCLMHHFFFVIAPVVAPWGEKTKTKTAAPRVATKHERINAAFNGANAPSGCTVFHMTSILVFQVILTVRTEVRIDKYSSFLCVCECVFGVFSIKVFQVVLTVRTEVKKEKYSHLVFLVVFGVLQLKSSKQS